MMKAFKHEFCWVVKRRDGLYWAGEGAWHRERRYAHRFPAWPRESAEDFVQGWNAKQGHIRDRRVRVVRLIKTVAFPLPGGDT